MTTGLDFLYEKIVGVRTPISTLDGRRKGKWYRKVGDEKGMKEEKMEKENEGDERREEKTERGEKKERLRRDGEKRERERRKEKG